MASLPIFEFIPTQTLELWGPTEITPNVSPGGHRLGLFLLLNLTERAPGELSKCCSWIPPSRSEVELLHCVSDQLPKGF